MSHLLQIYKWSQKAEEESKRRLIPCQIQVSPSLVWSLCCRRCVDGMRCPPSPPSPSLLLPPPSLREWYDPRWRDSSDSPSGGRISFSSEGIAGSSWNSRRPVSLQPAKDEPKQRKAGPLHHDHVQREASQPSMWVRAARADVSFMLVAHCSVRTRRVARFTRVS